MRVRELRLLASHTWVDVRLSNVGGRWLASADTPYGPSLGLGCMPEEALIEALEPFMAIVDELMASVPDELYWTRAAG
ncbi:MAG: hypothetical protein QOI85_2041 [Chloroflexota bacterium]|jgi:hypothetical protein|nr:hypothetical protein [Chloroflexota bacterium]